MKTAARHMTVSAGVSKVTPLLALHSPESFLTDAEHAALKTLVQGWHKRHNRTGSWARSVEQRLVRLVEPIETAVGLLNGLPRRTPVGSVRNAIVEHTYRHQAPMWAWSREQWVSTVNLVKPAVRQLVVGVAYLAADQRDLHQSLPFFERSLLVRRLFGEGPVTTSERRVRDILRQWGCPCPDNGSEMNALYDLMLQQRSPQLEDIDAHALVTHANSVTGTARGIQNLSRALVGLGIITASPFTQGSTEEEWLVERSVSTVNVPSEWLEFVNRWFTTSTL
ncbi:MAG TPA: hypothetical protein VNG12_03670, partial [Acidimicrobiales bacterium]|nr:hypothetical protein [Acidimicrobiales bacterium]